MPLLHSKPSNISPSHSVQSKVLTWSPGPWFIHSLMDLPLLISPCPPCSHHGAPVLSSDTADPPQGPALTTCRLNPLPTDSCRPRFLTSFSSLPKCHLPGVAFQVALPERHLHLLKFPSQYLFPYDRLYTCLSCLSLSTHPECSFMRARVTISFSHCGIPST